MNAPTVFSRLVLIGAFLAVVGLSYWFISTSLAPVTVPPVPPQRGQVRFDPSVDVSKKPRFSDMRLLGPAEVQPTALGRQDPFAPYVPSPPSVNAATTSATSTLATSTPTELPIPTSTAPLLP